MNRLMIALKAFWKVFTTPESANFLIDTPLKKQNSTDASHLHLLSSLQHSSRLIDFFKEDINGFTDDQIGAAVRGIHAECAKQLEELVAIRPLMEEKEGSKVKVPSGYDPEKIKLIGNIKGKPPFEGILIHKGWKAHKKSLSQKAAASSSDVLCPAEIEVQ